MKYNQVYTDFELLSNNLVDVLDLPLNLFSYYSRDQDQIDVT